MSDTHDRRDDPFWTADDGTAPTEMTLPPTVDAPRPITAPVVDRGALALEHPGRYVLRGELGEGGIGIVDRVYDRILDREVAIKSLRSSVSLRPDRHMVESRFHAEARITARLEHPGIVPVHELGRRADGALYYAMKKIRGETLRAAIDRADGLEARLALLPRFVVVGQAMAYAHSKGVVHRDLKPSNIMLGDFGETLVLDWGLARAAASPDGDGQSIDLADTDGRTLDGSVMGTPRYMPPEQLAGRVAEVDARSDVYAMGVILYELLTGRPPFVERSIPALLSRVPNQPAPDPRDLTPEAPPELAAIARRAVERDADDRYPDAGALIADVQAYQAGLMVQAHDYTALERLVRWTRRHRGSLVLVTSVLVVAAGAWIWRGVRETQQRARAEEARQAAVLARVDALLEEARSAQTAAWLDLYPARLAGLKEPLVEDRLIALLTDDDATVRMLAARSLGLMSSTRAVEPLIARLEAGVESNQTAVIETIRALAIIGDPRAEPAVYATRVRYGNVSYVGHGTEDAYRLLPPRPPEPGAPANALVDYGRALVVKGRTADGIAAYDQALALEPDLVRGLNNRGLALRRRGRYNAALRDLDRALTLDPEFQPSLINRATLHRYRYDWPGAVADLDRAVALASAGDGRLLAPALRSRARVLWKMGDLEGARRDLDRSLEVEGENRQNRSTYALFWHAVGDLDQALRGFNRAVQLDSGKALTLQQRGRVHFDRGDLAAARSDFEQAGLLAPDLDKLRADRIRVALAEGDLPRARVAVDRWTSSAPGNADAWQYNGLVSLAAGDLDGAVAHLDTAIERATPAGRDRAVLLSHALRTRAGLPPLPLTSTDEIPLYSALLEVARGERSPASVDAIRALPRIRCLADLISPGATRVEGPLRGPTTTAAACVMMDLLARAPKTP